MIPYTLIRSRRKTIGIYITSNATVEVRAPLRAKDRDILAFVESKQRWIALHLQSAAQRQVQKQAFIIGDTLMLFGEERPVVPAEQPTFSGGTFFLPPNNRKQAAIAIYRSLASSYLKERTAHFAVLLSVNPTAVKINGAKTRWGSCSGKNSLNFSWKLMLAPPQAIDYVVVHELCHIKQHNHSAAFWHEVAAVFPDYKKRQALLRQTQQKLTLEDWD